MAYSNSPLIVYTKLSPNHSGLRKHAIDTITIHCMAGNCTIEVCGQIFASTSRQASSNYGIGSDGRIGLYVEEKNRSWCTSSASNDNRAITIEVANCTAGPDWKVTDKALEALIELCVDICKRNNIKELRWVGDKGLIGKVDMQNMTVHRWFAAKACPGDYLFKKHGYIAEQVNKRLADTLEKKPDSGVKAKDTVILANDAVQFNGNSIPSTYKGKEYTVREIKSDTGRAVLELNGVVMYAVHVDYLIKKQTEPAFKPGHEPSDYAKTAWKKAMDKGVFDGTNPKNNVTREQLAVILDRLGLIK